MPKHPLRHLLGDGVVAGLTTWAVWRFLLRPLGRGIGRLAYRWRRVLTPLWFATGVEVLAVLWRALAPAWWPVALVLPVVGLALALGGPRLSEPLGRAVMALVPDSVDAGRKGVLDRVPERVYVAVLLSYLGAWLALRVGAGPGAITEWGWLAGTAGLGGVWWYHRRIRVAGRADRYARRYRKLAQAGEINPKFKVLRDSRVVGTAGSRRGLCTLTVRLAHGATAEDIVPILPNIASWYRLRRNAVTMAEDEDNSSRVVLRFLPRDPWRGKLDHPAPEAGSYTLASLGSRLTLGVNAAGALVTWAIQHALIVGRTGSGKSVLLESILRWVTGALDAVVVGADLASGATLGVWRDTLALPLAEDYDATVIMLRRVMAVVEDRERRLGIAKEADDEGVDSFESRADVPWLFAIIDEYPDWVAEAMLRSQKSYSTTREGLEHLALIGRIGKRGRKAKVRLILAAQNGSKADTGSKELQNQLTSLFGMSLGAHANRVLWKDLLRQGWSSLGLKVGQYLLNDDEHTTPDVTKGFWTSVRARREHVRAVAALGKTLEPSAWAALTDTSDEVAAAGMIIPAPELEDTDPILDQLHVGPATASDLVERTGLSRATVFRRLRAHAAAERVRSDDGIWSLVSETVR
jgi:hypothetical protein